MSLSWANKFAKSALLNAQKRIDSVLDIKDAENVEDGDLTYNAATAESGDGGESSFMTALDDEASRDLSISAVDVDPSDNHAPSTSAVDEVCAVEKIQKDTIGICRAHQNSTQRREAAKRGT